ncbi:uncharacterized protein LOC133796913 [Humulus lupulus]|uniref:uncharacterized protein LOC133796913 n=1 Tax=Humulus lupulus TaxID=3486 RepID=UPI002B40237E|nr:uncharacterized protein LOC133796913 [Humulus lupulus]
MAKSSSRSRKKNRSNAKASSEARTRKKTKTRSKKYESKKLRSRHVSDDDDSSNSMSGSSYSSSSEEIKLRSKRSGIHTKKDKKKAKRRSYSSESSEDSSRVRKRKESKRKRDYEAKNKSYLKKKRRRNDSPSSPSNRSGSCSTCKGGRISSHEVDFKRHSSKRAREERNLEKAEIPLKRSRYGSRSPSYSQCSESSTYQSKERVLVENNSRRLRSVITIVERPDEVEELNKDEHKEEMVFDYDDYPSCRSNDSNDVGNKRIENEKGEETAVSHLRFPKLLNTGKVSDGDDEDQFDGSNPSSKENGISHPAIEKPTTEVFGAIRSEKSDDLELVLRLKALENLRRFRGGKAAAVDQKDKNNGDEKAPQLSTTKAESVQIRFTKQDDTRVFGGNFPKEACAEESVKGEGIPAVKSGSTCSSQTEENIISKGPDGNEFASAKHNIARSTDQMAIADNLKQKASAGTSAVKSKLATPALKRQLSKTYSTLKQVPKCEETREKLLVDVKNLDETAVITAPTVTKSSNADREDINNASSSAALELSLKSSPGDTKSDTLQEEAKEGSQFEQKTMSVMRGGEMVQVSYKVYIPKKAPALARRQLKR